MIYTTSLIYNMQKPNLNVGESILFTYVIILSKLSVIYKLDCKQISNFFLRSSISSTMTKRLKITVLVLHIHTNQKTTAKLSPSLNKL